MTTRSIHFIVPYTYPVIVPCGYHPDLPTLYRLASWSTVPAKVTCRTCRRYTRERSTR